MTVHFGNKDTLFGSLEIGSGGISLQKSNKKLVIPSNHAWEGCASTLKKMFSQKVIRPSISYASVKTELISCVKTKRKLEFLRLSVLQA